MNPVGERVLWFVLGFVAGWLVCRFVARRSRPGAVLQPRVEAASPAPATPPVPPELPSEPLPAGPSPSRMIDVAAARAAGFNLKHADDLTIIEGIGPKTDELLRSNGVESFVQVAQLHVDALLDILQRGGPNFRLANPATWAQQALLAAENRWGELKRLQNEMIGGEVNHDA
jgi:predicted flap endonuclease-1-like 5' DNA nuclease